MKATPQSFGTILLLLGVFGYIFPQWDSVQFTNNENLFHVLTGLLLVMLAGLPLAKQKWLILVYGLAYLGLGIYGFTLNQPADFHIKAITAQLDLFDNYFHVVVALAFAWLWLRGRSQG